MDAATNSTNHARCPVGARVAFVLLKYTYGIVPIVAGVDKFLNYLTDWQMYLSPQVASNIPLSPVHIMYMVGIIEILAGLLVLSGSFTRIAAFILAAWLIAVALNLFSMGMYYDVAVRDVVMAVGAVALGLLGSCSRA